MADTTKAAAATAEAAQTEVAACMFDFSGTLLRIQSSHAWLRSALDAAGLTADDGETATAARRLDDWGAQPGGRPGALPADVAPELVRLWHARDLSAVQHRAAYTGLSRAAGLPWDVHDLLYDLHMAPDVWEPYPDAAEVLGALRERGVPVAVVSNIGWDLRPIFRRHGLDALVDVYVLSFEHGVQKPDPRIFRIACDALGSRPEQTLMVGDDRRADAGAAALGCPVHLVDHLPAADRPDGLRAVLDLFDP